MNGQSAVVDIICLIAEKIEHLRVHDCHHKVEGVIGVGDDNKESCFAISEGIKLHFVITHQLSQFSYVEGSKSRAAANQDRLCSLTGCQLVLLVLLHGEVVRLTSFKLIEHDVHGVFEALIILSGFGGIDHFEQGSKVFLVFRCFVPDVADEGCVVELFCLHPKIFAGLIAISLRVDDDRIDQLEDVFFRPDVGKWVIVHGLTEIDGVQGLDSVAVLLKHLAAFDQHCSFRIGDNIRAVHLHEIGLYEKSRLT